MNHTTVHIFLEKEKQHWLCFMTEAKIQINKYILNTIPDTEALPGKGQQNMDNGRQLETKYMLLSKL